MRRRDGHAPGPEGAPLLEFAEAAGFFAAAFGQSPDPMLDEQPDGDLGARFRATYDLGTDEDRSRMLLVQDVYPYAKPRPVTYMAPGQEFYGGMRTRGGWFVATWWSAAPTLREVLLAAGLPKTPPSADDRQGWPLTAAAFAATGVLLATAGLAVRARRRPHLAR